LGANNARCLEHARVALCYVSAGPRRTSPDVSVADYGREDMKEPWLVTEGQEDKEPSIKAWDALAEILRRRGKVTGCKVGGRPPLDVVVVLLNRNTIQSRNYERLRATTSEVFECVEPGRVHWIETWTRENAETQYFENLELLLTFVKG